jgi:cysteine desulfurase
LSLVYLDHAATTPLHPQVKEAMMPFLDEHFGNPSSIHAWGRKTRFAMDEARAQVASGIHAEPSQMAFTSGGTEADNMAILGVALANRDRGNHIITTEVEHHAILNTCQYLEKNGYDVTYLSVNSTGQIQLDELQSAITDKTVLISMMSVNNEIGTVQPIDQIGHLAKERGVYFHVDAVQALGIIEMDVRTMPVDLLSFSAHKINGPKGNGALYMATDVVLSPLMFGGSQERKRRAGTENIAGIIGFAEAMKLATENIPGKRENMLHLRQRMIEVFTDELGYDGFVVNGHPVDYSPRILNVSFPGTETDTMLMNMDIEGIAVASGSACNSGSHEISHVLKAMNLPASVANSAIRFSFGLGTSLERVEFAASKTSKIVKRIRKN